MGKINVLRDCTTLIVGREVVFFGVDGCLKSIGVDLRLTWRMGDWCVFYIHC